MMVFISGLQMVASHTMPNLLPGLIVLIVSWSALPVLLGAMLGAGLGKRPFAWRRIAGWLFGTFVGNVAAILFTFVMGWWLASLNAVPGPPRLWISVAVGSLCGTCLGFLAAKIGRPKKHVATLEEFDRLCDQIDGVVATLRNSESTGEVAVRIPAARAERLADLSQQCCELQKKRRSFHRARTLVHEELTATLHEAKALLERLRTFSSGSVPMK